MLSHLYFGELIGTRHPPNSTITNGLEESVHRKDEA